ncbi:MAG: transglycosylase domain-containing protein [Pseudomonadota bacterium]
MLFALRTLFSVAEFLLALPVRLARLALQGVVFNPKLGPARHVFTLAAGYLVFALVLVYVIAPVRGIVGQLYEGQKISYDSERWLATAIYDHKGAFVGTYGAQFDSRRDVNYTDQPIEIGDYTANPDHKSIPVREVPPDYWRCLVYHEDRHIGTLINPFGIDLLGVLKIPYTTIRRTIRTGRPGFGVGGSTLAMQLARVTYKTPPDTRESVGEKLRRKVREWWMAPVIFMHLTRDGDWTPLKQWAANHIWLAQRTGGAPLYGVEMTARVVFGKAAKDLSTAEQFVLASAVNKPIVLLRGSERLNAVRLKRWRYIAEVRARKCAEALIEDAAKQKQVTFELVNIANGPPDPRVRPRLQAALNRHASRLARRARANPRIRANALMPAARYGIRAQMKNAYGFAWRDYIRGVNTTLDVGANLALRAKLQDRMAALHRRYAGRITPGFTLDPIVAVRNRDVRLPDVIVAVADARGNLVRYFESSQRAAYFGSASAVSRTTGHYDVTREARQIASTGKIIAAIAIANTLKDEPGTHYVDTNAPSRGLESCRRNGQLRRGRRALTAFACSLNGPIAWRLRQVGQAPTRRLINGLGFNMPPAPVAGSGTPPTTAAVRGMIAGAPRRVHTMASVVLAALSGRGDQQITAPTLVRSFDYTDPRHAAAAQSRHVRHVIEPNALVKPASLPLLRRLLEAPLCYSAGGRRHGTLKSLGRWCAARRRDITLHFAKTGTAVTEDRDATVDTWIAGGLRFANGRGYSYVVVVGTGDSTNPWARRLHASQVAAPLLDVALGDLAKAEARRPVVAGRLRTTGAGPAAPQK